MKVLFVVSDLFFSEPLGAMILSAVCKAAGHVTRLSVLKGGDMAADLDAFEPDLLAYSAMTPDEHLFADADRVAQAWAAQRGRRLVRVMGGPHPTYFPDVLTNFGLDAICCGDGDRAILRILDALAEGRPLTGIPNVVPAGASDFIKEVVEDMDSIAFADRDLLYDRAPDMLKHGIRSFMTQRGCPHKCTYCFNHAYNRMFKGEGRKLIRRRSVDNLLTEIRGVVERYPTARVLRFGDDVFVIHEDEWLHEFAERYRKEIGIPFYCLIRCNALTEPVARLLQHAGCVSIAMSIEAGTSRVRNEIMKRNMPDEMVLSAFDHARQYGLNAFANSILALPGTTFQDDWDSFLFAKKAKAAVPTFSIFCPFPNTDLTKQAIELGALPADFDYNTVSGWEQSVLTNFTAEEKRMQVRLAHLGTLFCLLPDFMIPVLKVLIRLPLDYLYKFWGSLFFSYMLATRIFPGARPRDLKSIVTHVWRSLRYLQAGGKRKGQAGMAGLRAPATGLNGEA
jgi:radical SAM superfamily enzyme YgiQ (UPF0313 family)